ncbi:V-set and immunoglobulin domain-containing protein 8b isoform X2 [Engraulis encrasicolus]|uniref:V-set and immunoglobulin domain-containing protein 8b isoform X1 n=1 Tax=Engraulis encrasicolus TaxID=184585 RepID=UPI002FD6B7B6
MESVRGHVKSGGQVLLVLSLMHTGISLGMVVTSTGPQTLKRPQGESVSLGCTYSPGPSDIGGLDIEWSKVSPDVTQKDQLVLSFTGDQQYQLGPAELVKRMKFTGNPATGDASILISNLQTSDTSTYQCKVKKTPGIDSRKVTVVVLVRPSVPKCWVEGPEEKGGAVSLRCSSNQGSVPLSYTWSREDGANLPPAASMNDQTGELLIKNHSESFTGRYVCAVKNEVGQEQCVYNLQAYNPVNKAGVIAGAVIGGLLLLLLLLLLIWLIICCCNKKRYEKEVAHDIREDVVAPASRPASRVSSMRSIAGYHTHSGVFYSSVRGNAAPQRTPSGSASRHSRHSGHTASPPPDTASVYKPPLTYDSRYGYPV